MKGFRTSSPVVHSSDSKKLRRHILLQESMRRAAKKRTEAAQKVLTNQRKTPAIHETHNQYNKLPKLTPMDLSRMKAEKDARDGQDLALARQRQSEQVRLMREQTQRVVTVPTASAQQPQQSTSQPQPQPAQQVQQPLTQQQLQHQHSQIPQLHQLQAQQQAIQSQRSTGASSTIPNRSATARLSTTVNARPLSQQGQHLQQGRGVQVSVPLQASAQSNIQSQQNLLTQPQNNGNSFYGLPPNFTQEQVDIFHAQLLTAQQHQQQQQQQPNNQASPNGFITQS